MNSLHVKHLLVGGGLAASAAAQAIRARDAEGAVMLVGQEVQRPYHRPALSADYLLGTRPLQQLFTVPDDWFEKNNVVLRTATRATVLDATRHSVTFDNGQTISFDYLLIATGAAARPLKIPGAQLPNVYHLRSIDDADRLHHALEKARREGRPHDKGRGKVVVIGSGLLGVELAGTLSRLGLAVDLLLPTAIPWPRFAGETLGKAVIRYLEGNGVRVYPQSMPLRLEGDGRVQRAVLPSLTSIDCDLSVAALGIVPNKDLLRGTSIAAEKAILVDDHCRTSDPRIFAAGDCAAIFDGRFGKYRLLDHWTSAIETGRLAGANMAGANERYDAVNHIQSRVFDVKLDVWGESRHIQRRIVRGNTRADSPSLIEIGVSGDGRIAQVAALNWPEGHDRLEQLVRDRRVVEGIEEQLRDPSVPLKTLLA